ncbi:MAG: oligosaccharide flippase family protein [Nanoarchaeota archaeon]
MTGYIKNRIKKILPQGETSSHLIKTSFVYGFIAISLIVIKVLIARLYGQAELGIFTYFFSLADITFLFTSFGFAEALAKIISEDNKKTKLALRAYFPFISLSTAVFTVIALITTNMLKLNPSISFFNWAFVIYIAVFTLFYTAYSLLRGFKKFVAASFYSLVSRLIFIAVIVFAFLSSLQFYWVLIGMSVGVAAAAIFALPAIKKNLVMNVHAHSEGHPLEHPLHLFLSKDFLYLAFSLFIAQVGFYSLRDTSEIIIGRLLGFDSLGFYSAHTSVVNVIRLIAYVFPVIIMPMAVSNKYKLKEVTKKILAILIPFSLVVLIACYFLVPIFYGEQYTNFLLPLFLVVSSALLVLYSCYNSIFIGENKFSRFYFKIVSIDMLLSLVTNVLLNVILIYKMGLIGAPIATMITITLKIALNLFAINKLRKEQSNENNQINGTIK